MQIVPNPGTPLQVCGIPTPPGWITEPAALLEALAVAEAQGTDTVGTSVVEGGITGVTHGTGFLAAVLFAGVLIARRLPPGWPKGSLATAIVRRTARGILEAGRGGRISDPDAHPDTVHVGGAETVPDEVARADTGIIVPLRRGPSPDAVPVTLPPHIARMMARLEESRRTAPSVDPPTPAPPVIVGHSWVVDDG